MSNGSAATRWWENYLVRYFLPSVVGMFIVRWMDLNTDGLVSHYVPMLSMGGEFDSSHLIVWLLFGSLYCYVASYPVLVFHATRVLDFNNAAGEVIWDCKNPYIHALFLTFIAYVAAWYESWLLAGFGVALFSFVQMMRLYSAYSCRKKFKFRKGSIASLAYAYMFKLSARRGEGEERKTKQQSGGYSTKHRSRQSNVAGKGDQKSLDEDSQEIEKISRRNSDIVESYRHLREHGNTAFIVLLELAFCPLIWVALRSQKKVSNFPFVIVFLLMWIFPAVLVYLFAQHLERSYSLFAVENEVDQ